MCVRGHLALERQQRRWTLVMLPMARERSTSPYPRLVRAQIIPAVTLNMLRTLRYANKAEGSVSGSLSSAAAPGR